MVAVMEHFGHRRFRLAGHDRGGRVAHRLALDFPDRVERLAVLDIIPTIEHFERANMEFALGYYHWFWFAQPHPFPEVLINACAGGLVPRPHVALAAPIRICSHPDALADYLAAARDPENITGMCEDYRAAATIDLVHDRASRKQGQRIVCPLLALWGDKGKIGAWYDPMAIWRAYCDGPVTGGSVPSGHYIPEEAPAETLRWFAEFF